MTGKRPIRILHVVGGMNRGGVETWLMNVLRHVDRQRYAMDFLVHTDQPCAYDDEIRRLGARIIPCLSPRRPLAYARGFQRAMERYGPYQVVHSHVHHYSGYVLWLAAQAGVPVRIAHSHNDTVAVEQAAGGSRRLYLRAMERCIDGHATIELACSRRAAEALFGPGWQGNPRVVILYCGIDLGAFRDDGTDRAGLRSELDIPPDSIVLGHVGRFSAQKNHRFLLDVLAEAVRRRRKTHLLLVGDGPLRPAMEARARQLGLEGHVTFAGLRADVPTLMRAAMDVFVFPSLYEGLPLALVEVQAAGLPCVISDAVPEEADVVPELVRRLSLNAGPAAWADAVLAWVRSSPPVSQAEALERIRYGPFDIRESVRQLESIYSENPV